MIAISRYVSMIVLLMVLTEQYFIASLHSLSMSKSMSMSALSSKSLNLEKALLKPRFGSQYTSKEVIFPRFGLIFDAKKMNVTEFKLYYDGKYPVTLTNVLDVNLEKITEDLISNITTQTIRYDVRNNTDGSVFTYECVLRDYLTSLPDNSDHSDSMYFMSEDILRNQSCINDICRLPKRIFGSNYFDYFPEKIRPRNALSE